MYRVSETRALTSLRQPVYVCVYRITGCRASAEQRSFYDVICKGLNEEKQKTHVSECIQLQTRRETIKQHMPLSLYACF